MDEAELKSSIEIILRKEIDDLTNRRIPWRIKEENDIKSLNYKNSEALINIFSNIQNNEPLKNKFISLLTENIIESGESDVMYLSPTICIGSYSVSFYTLLRLGFVDEAITSLEQRKEKAWLIIIFFRSLFQEDYNYLNNSQLGSLLPIIDKNDIRGNSSLNDLREIKARVISFIVNNRFEILNKEIKGINIEINQDKKSVSEKIRALDFGEKYNEALDEIDKYLNTDTSNVLNSGMINILRVFMHDMVMDIAGNISSKKGEEIPKTAETPIGNSRNYIRQELKLSENEHKFINNFIGILHSEGGHAFTSNKEYFRLARNIAIEIILLLLSKYEQLVNEI